MGFQQVTTGLAARLLVDAVRPAAQQARQSVHLLVWRRRVQRVEQSWQMTAAGWIIGVGALLLVSMITLLRCNGCRDSSRVSYSLILPVGADDEQRTRAISCPILFTNSKLNHCLLAAVAGDQLRWQLAEQVEVQTYTWAKAILPFGQSANSPEKAII